MLTVPIIFVQTDIYSMIGQTLLFYEILKDFIVPIGIALLAVVSAYWIFVKETKRDKKKERKIEKQLQEDKLYYFANLVETIIKISEQQNVATLNFAKAQLENLAKVKDLCLISLNQLRRLTDDLQLENYMLSYVNYYEIKRKESIKEFNNIIVSIDTLYESFKNLAPHHEIAQDIEQKYKENFYNYYYRAHNLVAALQVSLPISAPLLAVEMNRIGASFLSNLSEDNDPYFYYSDFFVPFNIFAVKYVTSGLAETPQIQELAILTRDGKSVYEQLIRENQRLATEFQDQYKQLQEVIEKLKDYSQRLLKDFGK